MYDNNGDIFGFTYNGTPYYYVKNAQNDVTLILDENGQAVVIYLYDAWGNITDVYDSTTQRVSNINPITYRSYYYDIEMGVYYLNSRYYVPIICRFLSADGIVDTQTGMLSHNMFVYCNNNPVNYADPTGCLTGLEIAFGIIATIIVSVFVATLLKEPYSVDDALKDTGDSIAESVIPGLDKANNMLEFGDTVSSIDTDKGKYIDDIMRSDGSFSPQSFNPTICSSNEKYALYCLEMSDNLSRYASYHSISLQGKTFADLSIDEQKTLIDGMIIWDTGMCFDIHMSKGVRGVFALFT